MNTRLSNIHPGDILLYEFLEPLELSQNALARDIKVSPRRINEICLHKRIVSVDTAISLGIYFGIGAAFWLNLQSIYDLEEANNTRPADYAIIHTYAEMHSVVAH